MNARGELNFGGPNFDIEDLRLYDLTNEQYSEVFGFPALGQAVYGGFKVRF